MHWREAKSCCTRAKRRTVRHWSAFGHSPAGFSSSALSTVTKQSVCTDKENGKRKKKEKLEGSVNKCGLKVGLKTTKIRFSWKMGELLLVSTVNERAISDCAHTVVVRTHRFFSHLEEVWKVAFLVGILDSYTQGTSSVRAFFWGINWHSSEDKRWKKMLHSCLQLLWRWMPGLGPCTALITGWCESRR